MLARMVFTSSYGASTELTLWVSIVSRLPSKETFAPSTSSTRAKVCVSRRRGTLRRPCTPGASRVAAMTASAAFFEPEMRTVPSRGRPPEIFSLSTAGFLGCQRLHGKRMDLFSHAIAERLVDELMPLHAVLALERARHDDRLEVL